MPRLIGRTRNHTFDRKGEKTIGKPYTRTIRNGVAYSFMAVPLLCKENNCRVGDNECLAVEIPCIFLITLGIAEEYGVEKEWAAGNSGLGKTEYVQIAANTIVVAHVAKIEVVVILRDFLHIIYIWCQRDRVNNGGGGGVESVESELSVVVTSPILPF